MRGHLLEVVPRRESTTGAGDDNGANSVAISELLDRVMQRRDHFEGKAVPYIRPVQSQHCDWAAILTQQHSIVQCLLFQNVGHVAPAISTGPSVISERCTGFTRAASACQRETRHKKSAEACGIIIPHNQLTDFKKYFIFA